MGHTVAVDPTASAGLARSTARDQAIARHHRDQLVAAAAAVAGVAGHDPDRAPCVDAGCRLPEPAVCDVVQQLAALPDAPTIVATGPLATELERFTGALIAAADAVRHCRQHEHPGGSCWFSADGRGDGCSRVLRLLHALG